MLVLIPVCLWMARVSGGAETAAATESESAWERLKRAAADPDYRRLSLAFATCGFHMCIIQTHIYSQIVSYGIAERTASLAYTVFGVTGMTGDATVTPTSELVSRRFGPESLGFLFGISFVCHQIGGFLSSWLGGVFIEQSGNYTAIWAIDVALCALAALAGYRIQKNVRRIA